MIVTAYVNLCKIFIGFKSNLPLIAFIKDILLFLFIGFSLSFVTSLFCIKIFLSFVEKNSLTLFVILRLFLGFALLFYLAN